MHTHTHMRVQRAGLVVGVRELLFNGYRVSVWDNEKVLNG